MPSETNNSNSENTSQIQEMENENTNRAPSFIDTVALQLRGNTPTMSDFTWSEGREEFLKSYTVEGKQTRVTTSSTDVEKYLTSLDMEMAGAIDYTEDEPKIWKFRKYPEVCLATTLNAQETLVQCGTLPSEAVYAQPLDNAEISTVTTQLAEALQIAPSEPTPEYFLWYGKDSFNEEYPVKGIAMMFNNVVIEDVRNVLERTLTASGFEKTQFAADGPAASLFGIQKDKLGCLVMVENKAVKEALDRGESLESITVLADVTVGLQCATVL